MGYLSINQVMDYFQQLPFLYKIFAITIFYFIFFTAFVLLSFFLYRIFIPDWRKILELSKKLKSQYGMIEPRLFFFARATRMSSGWKARLTPGRMGILLIGKYNNQEVSVDIYLGPSIKQVSLRPKFYGRGMTVVVRSDFKVMELSKNEITLAEVQSLLNNATIHN